MKINCIIDNVKFKSKPQSNDTGAIINRMKINTAKEYSIEAIQDSILDGKTVRPSYCGASEGDWQSQQMFMIDIDNDPIKPKGMTKKEFELLCQEYSKTKHRTYDDVIKHCQDIGIIPNFIYTSFNHKPEHHKMRLVFILDNNIVDKDIAKKIQLYIMSIMGDVDERCKNLNRIYYAGRDIVFDSGNILDADRLIELSKEIKLDEKTKKKDGQGVFGVLDNNDIHNTPLFI